MHLNHHDLLVIIAKVLSVIELLYWLHDFFFKLILGYFLHGVVNHSGGFANVSISLFLFIYIIDKVWLISSFVFETDLRISCLCLYRLNLTNLRLSTNIFRLQSHA